MMLTIVSSHPVPYIALLMIRCYPELKSTTRTTVGGYHLRKHKHSFILVPLVWPNRQWSFKNDQKWKYGPILPEKVDDILRRLSPVTCHSLASLVIITVLWITLYSSPLEKIVFEIPVFLTQALWITKLFFPFAPRCIKCWSTVANLAKEPAKCTTTFN